MSLPFDIVALDLDFTLLNDDHAINPRNLAAVGRCRDLGVKVVVVSGRMYCSTLPYARALGVDTPAITYNGAYVKRESSGDILLNEALDVSAARELIDYCERADLTLNYYLDDMLYVARVTPWAELYAQLTSVELRPVGDLRLLADRAPTKALIVAEPERIARLYDELSPRFADRAYVTISNAEYLEFMPKGVDKGKALAVVAAYYGVSRDKVMAFGDANNDIPMIRWAGMGVAMANATPEARAAAARLAPRYDDDGVAVVLEEIFGCESRDSP